MADPLHSTMSHPPTPHPQNRQRSQCIEEGSQKSTRSDLSDDVEMETSTPMFQPAGFGSFHSAQQAYVRSTPQHDHITHQVQLGE
ncbi:hypothetical protein GcM3_052026 [Golovinomyces cichoracearum]|uniref:Uncharacterized protein n=1 Tax=Golovinomyces cichoracearum TaxID=62708 RepID=A0A420IZ35_9PEZI|nr:hypothetical protein GcM3_052026 [Golovinomyces cichoracearum]